jgi:hypothetical protein
MSRVSPAESIVPTFYFDIRDRQGLHRDDTGLEFPTLDAAIEEGRRALADMNRDALTHGGDQVLEILIRDHGQDVRIALSLSTERLNPGQNPDGGGE